MSPEFGLRERGRFLRLFGTIRVLLPLALMLFGNLHAAGFDCVKASTNVERLICANGNLSQLDDEVNRAYKFRTQYSPKEEAEQVQAEQREWLRAVRDKCVDVQCLSSAYQNRLRALVNVTSQSSSWQDDQKIERAAQEGRLVVNSEEAAKIEVELKQPFNNESSDGDWVSSCSPIVMTQASRVGYTAAGFCTTRMNRLVMACVETAVGHSAVEFPVQDLTLSSLFRFAGGKCGP